MNMSSKSFFSNFLVVAIFALLTFGVWAYLNRPHDEPAWPQLIKGGFDVAPWRNGKSPINHDMPTLQELDADIGLLEGKVTAIRLYQSTGTFEQSPEIAAKYHLNVTLGASLYNDKVNDENELEALVRVGNANDNVKVVFSLATKC